MRAEVRRGRKFIEYHDPETQPEGTFTQEIGAHDVSYLDTDGSWNPLDENWETDGQDGFSFRASRMNHKVRFDSIGAWRWYPRRNVETEYIVLNRPQCWLTATKRWGNLLVNGISREGKDLTLTSLRNVTRVIHSRWNGIKTDWILENANAPTRFRQKVDLVGITEIDGVLFGADGVELGRLTPTTATDANGAELECAGSYVNGWVEFSADVTGAVYPVTIDPDFVAGSSFGNVRGYSSTYSIARSTSYGVSASAIYLGQNFSSPNYTIRRGFLQFDTSAITESNTVSQVNLRMVCSNNYSDTDFDVQVVKYDWSAQTPLTTGNMEAAYDGCLAADSDSSIWRNTDGISVNTQYTSGNLATAWVNRTGMTYYGLRSNRDVSATSPTGSEYIYIATPTNATESYRPTLIVTYTAGSTGIPKHFLHYAKLRSN